MAVGVSEGLSEKAFPHLAAPFGAEPRPFSLIGGGDDLFCISATGEIE
jgi:hypothetical protein